MNIYFRHDTFRAQQKDIIKDILTSLDSRKNILVHAPTGTGKTDASLSAAITYAKNNNKKILFLTPKISQHKIALEVIKELNDKYQDLDFRAIDFVGKRNLCIDPGISQLTASFYEACKNQIKNKKCPFYENTKPKNKTKKQMLEARINARLKNKVYSHQEIKEISSDFKDYTDTPTPLCAYELAKIYAKKSDIIIADYYHVFSKQISDSLLTELNIDLKDCVLIIDEAHNLEDRLVKLLSKTLSINLIQRAQSEAQAQKNHQIKSFLKDFETHLEDLSRKKLKQSKEEFIQKEEILPENYYKNYFEIMEDLERTGVKFIEENENKSSSLVTIALFLEDWIKNKQSYIRFITSERNQISIKHNALDVSILTKDIFQTASSSIIMSATLTPLLMYQEIFGLTKENTDIKEYDTPFLQENKLELLIDTVSTKYTHRSKEMYDKIARNIQEITNSIPGNTIIFFPSFDILKQVEPQVKSNKPKLIQTENQDQKDFDDLIKEFKTYSKSFGALFFAVMGGKASEGIDLPGNQLISAIIVGLPLSRMHLYTKAKIDYYQEKYKKGWLYAYTQPALQKTVQSAGRVIRSQNDRGVIIFMDQRYSWSNYKQHIPKHIKYKKSFNHLKEIKDFFNKNE